MPYERLAAELDNLADQLADRLESHVRRRAKATIERVGTLLDPVDDLLVDLYFDGAVEEPQLRRAEEAMRQTRRWLSFADALITDAVDRSAFDPVRALSVDLRLGLDGGLVAGTETREQRRPG